MNYYKLPEDKQWMRDDHPGVVGGRDTDVSQIGYTLAKLIKDWYPINSVSPAIVGKLEVLVRHLKVSEQLIYELIEAVSKDIGEE